MSGRLIVNGSSLIVHRLIIFFLSAIFLLAIINYLLPIAHAQTSSSSPSATIPYTLNPIPSTVSPTSPLYTDLILHNMFHSFSCLAIGSSVIGQPCLTYQLTQNAQGAIQSVPVLSSANLSGGLLGTTTGLIAGLYMNPPVRTADYLASVGEGLGVVKPAHAQVVGSGAAVLNPILKLWQVSRNVSYVIMIIIFVVIGLMVMFRQRINPQTVITAQAALPGLVIGLVLITFSYFLAALITDTAFIGTNLVGYYFSTAQPSPSGTSTPSSNLADAAKSESVISIMGRFTDGYDSGEISNFVETILSKLGAKVQILVRGFAALLAYQYGSLAGPAIGAVTGFTACSLGIVTGIFAPVCGAIGSAFGPVVTGGAASLSTLVAPGPVLGQALWVVVVAIILYTMFKLLLRLINNFLSIIFLTVTAPFHFLAASLPGRQGLATNWILNMLCNVLAFPAVMAVFYFVAFLLGQGASSGQPFNVVTPYDLTNTSALPLFGGLNLSILRLLVAFGALLATPAIPDVICRTIGRVTQAGQLIGQEITGGVRGGEGYAGQAQERFGGLGRNITTARQEYRGGYFDPKGIKGTIGDVRTAGNLKIFGRKI